MRLIIAEKPSLGRAIAQALHSEEVSQNKTAISCENNTIVTWCFGHLLELAPPEHYSPAYRKWAFSTLPILPNEFQHIPRKNALAQLHAISELIPQASIIIHAGDPDREGQLLVDELLEYFHWKGPVERLLINDLTPAAVSRALSDLKPNQQFRHLSHCAKARQQADWLFGINLTRAITLVNQQPTAQSESVKNHEFIKKKNKTLFSVGRVQTPVLGLVVRRDEEIEHFVSHDYFRLKGKFHIQPETNSPPLTSDFTGFWITPETLPSNIIDHENRITQQAFIKTIASKFPPVQPDPVKAEVTEVIRNCQKTQAPLLYSLSALQIDAALELQLSAQKTLNLCQMLYEKYQLITYPRSDCRYLPTEQYAQRVDILTTMSKNDPALAPFIHKGNPAIKSRVWNGAKTGAHHGIIPTLKHHSITHLTPQAQDIYRLIARQYLAQFYPDKVEEQTKITLIVRDEQFCCQSTRILEKGWSALFNQHTDTTPTKNEPLFPLNKGHRVYLTHVEILKMKTPSPTPFNDASLLSAIAHIARFVQDPILQKTLRETDGLGTEATRAGIIETLFHRQYLQREARYIRATPKAKILIHSVPEALAKPDMTAVWEATLETIRSGSTSRSIFIERMKQQVKTLIHEITQEPYSSPDDQESAPQCPQCQTIMRLRTGKSGDFWACPHYPSCSATLPITIKKAVASAGTISTPIIAIPSPPIPCPQCHAPLVRRNGKNGFFWGCSQFPSCRKTLPDKEGKPLVDIHLNNESQHF